MNLQLDVQVAVSDTPQNQLPDNEQIHGWVNSVLHKIAPAIDVAEMTVRIVDETEIAQLNEQYRQKTGATNVLSFPFELPPGMPEQTGVKLLGDVVVCAAVVLREALAQGKSAEAHWAHMIVHGTLHLLGYDHLVDDEAEQMESLEVAILGTLGYADPYQ